MLYSTSVLVSNFIYNTVIFAWLEFPSEKKHAKQGVLVAFKTWELPMLFTILLKSKKSECPKLF